MGTFISTPLDIFICLFLKPLYTKYYNLAHSRPLIYQPSNSPVHRQRSLYQASSPSTHQVPICCSENCESFSSLLSLRAACEWDVVQKQAICTSTNILSQDSGFSFLYCLVTGNREHRMRPSLRVVTWESELLL